MIDAVKRPRGFASGPFPASRVRPSAEPHRDEPRRPVLGTRGWLVAAFVVLAVAIAGAFGSQLARLYTMRDEIAELVDHQQEIEVALQIEKLLREEYAPRALPEPAAQAGAPDRLRQIEDLVRQLERTVDEPRSKALVADLAASTRAFDESVRAELANDGGDGDAAGDVYRLVMAVEMTVHELVAFLRNESVVCAGEVEEIRREALRLAIGFVLLLPLFALALGFGLSRAIGGPLAFVRDAAARISRGDLRALAVPRGPPEVAEIAGELNAMAASLEHHQERLVRTEKLAGLGRFAAGIAHEINNPLQVLIGYLSLHRGKVSGELGRHLAQVEREAARCKEIVDALLQLSRPVSSPHGERVDLRALVDEVTDAIRVTTPDVPPIHVAGSGDARGCRERFRQVLVNLLRNAAEAAGPAGLVEVEIGAEGDTVRVIVADSGPGIPPELRARMFEPFFTTKPGGTGLGLALARAVAQAYGGDVELEPSPAGARFRMTAPRHTAEARG